MTSTTIRVVVVAFAQRRILDGIAQSDLFLIDVLTGRLGAAGGPGAPAGGGAPGSRPRPAAAPTSAPPNLHALQQQLAITLAASHLSQEQINSLAIQLYKQAQQQQQQQQRAQPDGSSQGSAPTGMVGHAPRFVPVPQPSAGSHTTSLPANHHATPPSRQT